MSTQPRLPSESIIMLLSSDFMRFLLLVCIFCMALLSAFYLRRRVLTPLAYAGWGLLALMLPIIGPFLVIWAQPGQQAYSKPHL